MKIPTADMAGQTPTQLHETQSRRVEEELENDKAKYAQILATDLKQTLWCLRVCVCVCL
ncbi:unnamed protein product, partial [Brassica oleracea var. botrytis]